MRVQVSPAAPLEKTLCLISNFFADTCMSTVQIPIVAGVCIRQDGKVLLVQEAKPKVRGLWNFPAGKVEEGDTIETTAAKEAREETGYSVQIVRELGLFHEELQEPVKHLFEATVVSGTVRYDPNEILDVSWFSETELERMEQAGQLRGKWVMQGIRLSAAK
jgi:8-oxo-dGTP diphosphatase